MIVRLALLLVLPLTGLVLLVGVLGGLLPSRSPLAADGRCPAPCWRGVAPGEVTIANAHNTLLAQGYISENSVLTGVRIVYQPPADACAARVEHRDAIVTEIRLDDCGGLRLGDVMAALGPPDGFAPTGMHFPFRSGSVLVRTYGDGCDDLLTPFLRVRSISLMHAIDGSRSDYDWHGFMPTWAYRRLTPGRVYLGC